MATLKTLLSACRINANRSSTLLQAPSNIIANIGSTWGSTVGVKAVGMCAIHTGNVLDAWSNQMGPKKWLRYNYKVFPPQEPTEERRPAFVCHMRPNIRIQPKKLWYSAVFIRGMSIDEAFKQLSFSPKYIANTIAEILKEAQEMAVKHHNVEFKSNLWVAESFCGRGQAIKGIRRHARRRAGVVEYKHSHYFVRLEEGKPPEHYCTAPKSGEQMLEEWMTQMRQRKIKYSL